MADNNHLKNDDETFQAGTFLKICNSFFNYVALSGCPIAAGDCLLHYMHSSKKKHHHMTPQSFYTCFQKALRAVKILDHCYEKELENTEFFIIFFYSFPKDHIQDYVHHGQHSFDNKTLKDLKNFFRVTLTQTHPKNLNVQPIIRMTETTPLVVIESHSLIVMMPTHHQQQTQQLCTAQLNVLAIVFVPFPDMTLVCHKSKAHCQMGQLFHA